MKVWKSPVLYMSILLVFAVLAALAAPFVINWNVYRADLESYGKALTGRSVTIEGPISARLFPWPRLTVDDVHVANLPGLESKEFASAARIDLRMQLGGLFSGTIQVESIDIQNPIVAFERNAAGDANWVLTPDAVAPRDLLQRVKLDRIRLVDGIVRIIDRRRGNGVQLDDVNASLSAPALAGPWRLRGLALYRGQALDISANTGSIKAGEPLKFSGRVAAADSSGFVYSFDGAQDGARAKGTVRIEPAAALDAKSDAEGRLRPMVLTAKTDAGFDDVAFDDIQISPQDPKDGGTLMTGSARLQIGSHITATAALEAPRIDVDAIAGAQSLNLLRDGQGLSLATQVLSFIPPDVSFDVTAKSTSLLVGGEALENVSLALLGDRQSLKVKRFYAGLPGRSEILLSDGLFLPGDAGAELAGSLALESHDTRALVNWLWPEARPSLNGLWKGSRGQFKMQSDFSLKPGTLQLNKAQYELEGAPGTFTAAFGLAAPHAVDLKLETASLDLDGLLGEGRGAAFGLLPALLPHAAQADVRLSLKAGRLALNAVEAQDVALDLASSGKGLDLRSLHVGSAGGARLEASGLILDAGAGNDGSVDVALTADDPRGFLRLVGLFPKDQEPQWTTALGKTDVKGKLALVPNGAGAIDAELNGTSGALTIDATGTIENPAALAQSRIRGTVDLNAPTAAPLADLVGFVPASIDQAPAHVVLTADGSRDKGFNVSLQAQALAASFEYTGTVSSGLELLGKATLRSTNATPVFAALGLPTVALPSGNLVLDAELGSAAGQPLTVALEGRVNESPLKAGLQVDEAGKITGNVDVGPVSLRDVLALAFLSWTGQGAEADSPFAPTLPFGLEGEVWVAPQSLTIGDTYTARDVQLVLTSAASETHLELYGKDVAGRDAKIRLTSRAGDGEGARAIEGKVTLPINLSQQLKLVSGAAAAEGDGLIDVAFQGQGRSPGGVLASLSGTGTAQFKDLRVLDINPEAFKATLAQGTDTAAITAAFEALRHGGGLDFGEVSSTVTIVNGEASLLPIAMKSDAADATIKVLADLALGRLDAAVTVGIHDSVERPAMEVSYAGPPGALLRAEDKAALFGQLGVSMMDKGVAELERLRQEQEKLAAEEAQALADDQEKLQDYYAQRDELRARQRELKVHAVARQQEADTLRAALDAERGANLEINKTEMKQRLRELRLYRRLAKSDGLLVGASPPPAARPKPKVIVPPAPAPAPLTIPDIIIQQPLPLPPSQDQGPVSPSQ